jgi:hypothetical protein
VNMKNSDSRKSRIFALTLAMTTILSPECQAGWDLHLPSLPLPPLPHLPGLPPIPSLPSLPPFPGSQGFPRLPGLPPVPSLPGLPVLRLPQLPNCGGDICNFLENVKRGATNGISETTRTVQDTKVVTQIFDGSTLTQITNAHGDAITTIVKAGGDFVATLKKADGDVIATYQKANRDVTTTYQKANDDTVTTVTKGWRDVGEQSKRDFENLVGAGTAIKHYAISQANGYKDSINHAEHRIREGKVVDALWGLGTEPVKNEEANAFQAVHESVVLNTAAQVAASAYGGPGGAAAYAAWYTYRETGNVELAIKAGILTGAASAAAGAAGKMPSGTSGELVKKAIVSGSIGGLAVAAAGGDKEAIKNGFLLSASMVLIQDGYRRVTDHPLDGKIATKDAYCMRTLNAPCSPPPEAYLRDGKGNILDIDHHPLDLNGNKIGPDGKLLLDNHGFPQQGEPFVDVTKTDPLANHVGKWSTANDHSMAGERGALMTGVSKVPGMNTMAMFHDQWAVSWKMGDAATIATIYPATVLTYVGTGAPLYTQIQTTVVSSAKGASQQEAQKQGAKPPSPPSNDFKRTSYLCYYKKQTRTIALTDSLGTQPCQMTYTANGGLISSHGTAATPNMCVPAAERMVSTLQRSGWACLVR